MTNPRTVLRTLQLGRHALASARKPLTPFGQAARGVSSSHLRQPSPELVNRLKTVASDQQLKALLIKAAEAESPLVSIISGILRQRNGLDHADYVYILRDIRYALSNPNRETSTETLRQTLRETLAELKKAGGWLDSTGQAELVRINVLFGDERAMESIEQTVRTWGDSRHFSMQQWNAYVELLYKKQDQAGLEEVLRAFERKSAADTPIQALDYLVMLKMQARIDSKSEITAHDVVAVVEEAQQTSRTDSSTWSWAAAIRYLLERRPDALDVATEVHHILRDRGMETDHKLALAFITPLCAGAEPRMEEAMLVYTEYLASASAEAATSEEGRSTISVFSTLLAACARHLSSANVTTALRILNDMRARHISLSTPVLTSTAVSLIRASPDHNTAFSLYAHLYALNSDALDRQAYDAILAAFIKLSTETSPFAPAHLYLEIMRDMRKARFRLGPYSMTTLLTSYGAHASRSSSSSSSSSRSTSPEARRAKTSSLLRAITELHTVLKLDPTLEVDVPLLNALMDAYARVGAYAEAFEVWDELVERRAREPQDRLAELYSPTINIYLDACGYSYSLLRARKGWAWATRWGLNKDERNWAAWIECLCRCGRIDESIELFIQMREGKAVGAPTVTKNLVALPLKFAARDQVDLRCTRDRIRQEFPDFWDDLKQIGESDESTS